MSKSINNNQLTPGKQVWVRGRISYCRVTSQVAGRELDNANARRKEHKMRPINKPYTTVTINHAQIIPVQPGSKTLEEQYIEERFYTASDPTKAQTDGYCCSVINKGKRLPYVAYLQGNQMNQIVPEGELQNGLDVTIVIRTFKSPDGNGITLDGIILNEQARYYSNNTQGFIERGITFNPVQGYDDTARPGNGVAEPIGDTQPVQQTPISQTPASNTPFSANNGNGAPYNPAQSAMYNPAQGNAYNPAQQTVPPQQPQQVAPNAPYNPAQQAQQAAPQTNPQVAPNASYNPAQQAAPQQGGIRYDAANDRNY